MVAKKVSALLLAVVLALGAFASPALADHTGDYAFDDSSNNSAPVGTKCRQAVSTEASPDPFGLNMGQYVVKVTLDCVEGMLPDKMVVTFYKASVRTPNENKYHDTKVIECVVGQNLTTGGFYNGTTCTGQATWTRINYTVHAKATSRGEAVCMTACGLFEVGRRLSGTSHMLRTTFNDKGMPYPVVRSTRGDQVYVPFPAVPLNGWVKCPAGSDTNKDDPGCWRDPEFPKVVRALYNTSQWTVPESYSEAHHICPREWRNCTNSPYNAVLLSWENHTKFSKWWASFTPRYFW